MIVGPSAGFHIAVRWHWTEGSPTSMVTNGSWTVPTAMPTDDVPPSILYPAPFVGIAHTSGSTLPAGANWTGTFDGEIDVQKFRLSFEWAGNGTEIRSVYFNVGPREIEFNTTLPFATSGGGAVPPGAYLVHLHNACDASILHSLTLDVSPSNPTQRSAPSSLTVPGAPPAVDSSRVESSVGSVVVTRD